jgi:hypothetical protein
MQRQSLKRNRALRLSTLPLPCVRNRVDLGDDLGFGRHILYLTRGLDSAYSGKADVHKDEIWLKLIGFLDCIFAGCRLTNYIQLLVLRKKRTNRAAHSGVILYYEKPNPGHLHSF